VCVSFNAFLHNELAVQYFSPQTTSSQIFIIASGSFKGLLPHYNTLRRQTPGLMRTVRLQASPTQGHNRIFFC